MPDPVTDPDILNQLGDSSPKPVADPNLLKQLDESGEQQPTSWGEVASGAARNAIPSAIQLGKDVATPFIHPLDTAKAIGETAKGFSDKLANKIAGEAGLEQIPEAQSSEKTADALVNHFSNRYGGLENLKQTMANDPAGFLADAATILSGGAALGARAPGVVGTIARTAGTVGDIANPLTLPLKATNLAGHAGAEILGQVYTGAGSQPIRTAFRSGVEGGDAGKAFWDNFTKSVPQEKVVQDARQAVRQMRAERAEQYQTGMVDIRNDANVLSFDDIDKALQSTNKIKSFSGRTGTGPTQQLSPKTAGVRQEIQEAIDHWKSLDPNEFHTPAGFDALKQYVGDIKDSLEFNTPQRAVAEGAYNSIRQTIAKQAPTYDKVMKGYEGASNQIDEITKTLSLNPKASVDTALRKLQSSMRDSVNTNFGQRQKLTEALEQHGAPNIMEGLAGQSLKEWIPRGLIGRLLAGGAGYAALHLTNPYLIPALAASSPKVVGAVSHGAGRAVGMIPEAIRQNIGPLSLGARAAGETEQQPQFKKGGAVIDRLKRSKDRLSRIEI